MINDKAKKMRAKPKDLRPRLFFIENTNSGKYFFYLRYLYSLFLYFPN